MGKLNSYVNENNLSIAHGYTVGLQEFKGWDSNFDVIVPNFKLLQIKQLTCCHLKGSYENPIMLCLLI